MTPEEHAMLEALKDYYEFCRGWLSGAVPSEDVRKRHDKLILACNAHVAQHDGRFTISED